MIQTGRQSHAPLPRAPVPPPRPADIGGKQLTMDGRELSMAEVAAEQGIEQVAAGATSPEWSAAAKRALRWTIADTFGDFTTDDVWYWLEKDLGPAAAPPEPRAMGAVMRWAVSERLCAPTGEYRKSERPQCHGRPLRVWQAHGALGVGHTG